MAQNPPKQTYNFSFDSPDLRARNVKKESIYDDSSEDETPRRVGFGTKVNRGASGFGARSQPGGGFSGFSNLNRQGGSVLTSGAVKTETSGASSSLFKGNTTGMADGGFGLQNAKENNSTTTFGFANQATSSGFSSHRALGGGVAGSANSISATSTKAQEAAGRSALQDMQLLGGLKSPGFGGVASTLNAFTSTTSTQGTSSFTVATTATAQAASASSFQNTPSQSQSVLGSASSTSASSGTFPLAATPTTTAQTASGSSFQTSAARTLQSLNYSAAITQSSSASAAVTTAPRPMMAQTEDSRLFAAHMKLLDHGSVSQDLHEVSGTPLFTKKVLDHSENLFSQYGFLAGISNILDSNAAMNLSTSRPSRPADPRLFFNISAPSSAFICGSQGSGKSHTLSCLLENCLMKSDVSKLDNPLAGLVFHYDSFTSDVKGTPCEAAHISSNPNVKVRVLVSPTNLQTMKRTYAGLNVTVEPLRINQTDLNTKRMFDLMVVDQEGGKMPLYLHAISRILREMHLKQQQSNTGFNYREFKRQVDLCDMTPHQLLPLNQRLDTLESFMPRSQTSVKPLAQSNISGGNEFFGSNWSIKAGTLTIVDLSCPCVTAEGACALFNMCLSLFLEQHTTIGRVIGLDEAHKYMNAGAEASSLTDTLLSAIRLQRHLGTRVFISTQEPTISPKLLDLCSMTIVHRFTSPDWLRELKNHLASLDHDEDSPEKSNIRLMKIFNDIVKLRVGEAFLFAPSAIVGVEKRHNLNGLEETEMNRLGNGYLKIKVRARVTSDGGKSVFALGAEPTIKTEGNMFGFPAAKPVHGVPQAGSGAVGGIKPATSLFQFPSTKGLNNSVLAASSAAVIATSGSSQPATDFGAPSPTLAHISIFGSRNSQATSNVALFAGIDKGNFDPFKSAERTTIGGTFTTRTPSIFSIFSFSTVPAPGTRCAPFQPFVEKEPNSTTNQQNAFQSIGFQLPYTKFSPEELRLADYVVGVRYSGQWKFEGQFK